MAIVLLSMPMRVSVGANYWDLILYVDAGYRISLEQWPHVDFFSPVGPLCFYLHYIVNGLFPAAQTVFAVHYSLLIVTLPLMLLIVSDVDKRSRKIALALIVPFALFSLLPINGVALYPAPGFDGYGSYNRHVAMLLYQFSAVLLLVENRGLRSSLVMIILVCLLAIKITGFAVGIVLLIHAIIVGRICLRASFYSAIVMILGVAVIEWHGGIVHGYLFDVVHMVSSNVSFLLPRVNMVLAVKLDVVVVAGVLIALLLWQQSQFFDKLSTDRKTVQAWLDSAPVWLASLLIAGVIFETQNTGSHEFILLWPAIVLIVRDLAFPWRRGTLLVMTLIALLVVPTPVSVLHRGVRAFSTAMFYEPLELPLFAQFGRVSARRNTVKHAQAKTDHYVRTRHSYQLLAEQQTLPSEILFSEHDFQVSWLMSSHAAAVAILEYERQHGVYFRQTMTLDFVDPITSILKREPVQGISIGNDPSRTLAVITPSVISNVKAADAWLVPLCPVTYPRRQIAEAYIGLVSQRKRVTLTPCYDLLIRR